MLRANPRFGSLDRPTPGGGFTLVEADDCHAAGTHRNVFVILWAGDTKAGAVARLTQPLVRLLSEYPHGGHLMQVVAATAGPPSAPARSAIANMFRTASDGIISSSLVVPGVGFRMATARAIATGMIMLARPPFPHEVHASVERAAAWHASLESNGDTAPFQTRHIVAAVQSLEAAITRWSPDAPRVANGAGR